ncbi:hypothetical protein GM921_13460 [Pedobacter sp. LMG 31464]|uniref:Uncharacterized protein n=1 Tax=Pedobacter planticolens TaxID=2679964 RepID=A0A923IWT9_9SPHI|nr:hypothetical protein [Pedobacter planticolens]MBB2146504.1 hypothetical protein [Pedobacter planticolens]
MNNTFNIQRFGLLLKRQWLEFGKIYLITLAVALGVIVTFYSFSLWGYIAETKPFYERALNFREPLFLIFGFLFITVIASNYFAHLGQKPKAIIDLMIPASTFEKFLTGIFFTAILSTVSFIFIFYVTDLAFLAKLRSVYHSSSTRTSYTDAQGAVAIVVDNLAYFFSKNGPHVYKGLYIIPFFVTSIFLLGSIYFNKFHYIKTTISAMVFSGIWTAIIFKSGKLLFDNRTLINRMGNNGPAKDNVELCLALLLVLLTLIFWSITYVRLKEKQV